MTLTLTLALTRCAETDKQQEDNQAKAKKWLAEVEKQSDDFANKVKSGELGGTPDPDPSPTLTLTPTLTRCAAANWVSPPTLTLP